MHHLLFTPFEDLKSYALNIFKGVILFIFTYLIKNGNILQHFINNYFMCYNMKFDITKLITLLNNYYSVLPINELKNHTTIINELRLKNLDVNKIKKTELLQLVEVIADTIYTEKKCVDKYHIDYYQQTKIYDEPELNYCSDFMTYLQHEIEWDNENAYDKVFQSQFTKSKEET